LGSGSDNTEFIVILEVRANTGEVNDDWNSEFF